MMGTEQFSLKWNNHTHHLVDVFGNLLEAESLVDVTLSCEGQSLKCHKLVLSACSPYFKELFQDHVENHPIVILKDVKFAELRCIIEFMYKGEVEVEKNDLDSLFLTAEGLMIKGLAGSRPPVSGVRLRVPPPPPAPEHTVDRKRPRPADPFDTGGDPAGGGGGGGDRGPPTPPPPGQPPVPCSNGEDNTVIKHPKLEPVSTEENSTDGMEPGSAAGTAYLCRECGCSFHSQHQLQEHHAAEHGAGGGRTGAGGPEPPPAAGAGVIRAPPARARQEDPSTAPPVHSHSWPPHDGRDRPLWTEGETPPVRLPAYLQNVRSDLRYLPSGIYPTGISGGILGMMPMMPGRHVGGAGTEEGRGPLNLSAGDGAASPGASEERSEPSTPTPAEDGGPVTCKVCTRVFETPAALREHASVHQGDRPFKCTYCGKAFKFRHHLKDHCRIHTGERPFDCKTCGKSFARSSILKTHTKTHKQEERRFELATPYLAGGVAGLASTANIVSSSLTERPSSLTEGPASLAERSPGVVERPPSLPERPGVAALPTPPSPPPPVSAAGGPAVPAGPPGPAAAAVGGPAPESNPPVKQEPTEAEEQPEAEDSGAGQ